MDFKRGNNRKHSQITNDATLNTVLDVEKEQGLSLVKANKEVIEAKKAIKKLFCWFTYSTIILRITVLINIALLIVMRMIPQLILLMVTIIATECCWWKIEEKKRYLPVDLGHM